MFSKVSVGLLALGLCGQVFAQGNCTTTCQSFGVDFMSGGTYFQNIASTDPFTAVQEFDGCQADESNNILVAPSGDQYECSKTPLTPDDTLQTVTCPIDKNQLTSGDWSLIIISNNGQCDPIDYIRQFSLTVGEQSTSTVVPTVTLTTTSTPISSTIITDTTTITSSAPASTTTVRGAPSATVTFYPLPTFTIVTRGVFTMTSTSQVADVVATSTVTTSGPCFFAAMAEQTPQSRRQVPDPVNDKISATILSSNAARDLPTATPIARRGGSLEAKRVMLEARKQIVEVRSIEPRALNKRAPDEPTTTITDSTAAPSTETSTTVAPTSTVTGTTTLVQTSMTTPIVTVNRPGARATTVTAPGVTFTNIFWIPVTEVVVTRTSAVTATITSSVGC